jgi:hypothetical protein
MRLFDITEAIAYPDHTVAITWSDGMCGVVDFLPIIDRGGWSRRFGTVIISSRPCRDCLTAPA